MSISLYPEMVLKKDLTPDQFGSDIDALCEEIKKATDGWGADKEESIDALSTKDAETRIKIALRYKELYDADLYELMKKEFSGDFGTAMEFLALPADRAEAAMLHKAMAGIGSSAAVIASVLVGRTNEEIDLLKKAYFAMYNRDLGERVASELRGDMERLMLNCLQESEVKYDPEYHTAEKAAEDAEEIYSKGQGKKWGTDEKGIFTILCASPPEHVKKIDSVYADKYECTLERAMEKELGGMLEENVQRAAMHLVAMKLNPHRAIAAMIKASVNGFGPEELEIAIPDYLLLTCCVIRYQRILAAVQSAHIEMYKKTIHDRVKSETGFSHLTVLLNVLNVACPEAKE